MHWSYHFSRWTYALGLCKKHYENSLLQLVFARLLVVFTTSYLFVATIIWGYTRLDYSHTISDGLTLFVQKIMMLWWMIFWYRHHKSKTCLNSPWAEKKQCEDKLKIFIATQPAWRGPSRFTEWVDSWFYKERREYPIQWTGTGENIPCWRYFVKLIGYWNDQEEPQYPHCIYCSSSAFKQKSWDISTYFHKGVRTLICMTITHTKVTVSIPLDNNNNEGYYKQHGTFYWGKINYGSYLFILRWFFYSFINNIPRWSFSTWK